MKAPSLRQRLLWLVGLPVVLAWLLAGAWTAARVVHETREMFDEELLRTAGAVLAVLPDAPAAIPPAPAGDAVADAEEPEEGPSMILRDGSGRVLMHHGPLPPLAFDPGPAHFHTVSVGAQRWRVYQRWDAGHQHWLQLAAPLDQRDELIRNLAGALLLPLAGLLLVLPLAIMLGLRLGLAPLRRVTRTLARNPAETPELSVEGVPAELLPLTRALDSLVVRLAGALQRERGFTADAAHELRHPLSVLRMELDLAGAVADADERRRHLERARTGLGRMERLVAQLLVLARVDSLDGLADAGPVPLQDLLGSALREASVRGAQRGVTLSLDAQEAIAVQGSAGLLAIAAGNLLDNAIRHARTAVVVTLEPGEGQVGIVVEDDGPGFDPAALPRLGERFHRGHASGGSGLGLSIVRAVAALHGGEVEFGRAKGGGARVVLRLPQVPVN